MTKNHNEPKCSYLTFENIRIRPANNDNKSMEIKVKQHTREEVRRAKAKVLLFFILSGTYIASCYLCALAMDVEFFSALIIGFVPTAITTSVLALVSNLGR